MDTKKLRQKILDLAIRGKLVPSYAIGHSLIRYISLILSLYAPGLENLFLGIIDFLEFLQEFFF